MRLRYVPALLALVLSAGAPAQFTITADDLRAQFNTERTYTYHYADGLSAAQAQGLIDAAGANQTWDLTGFDFSEEATFTVRTVSPVTGLAGADAFPDADYAIVDEARDDSSYAVFFDIQDDGTYTLGFHAVSGEQTFQQVFDPPLFGGPLPIAFGSAWSATTSSTITIEGVPFTSATELTGSVDSYGTLTTPEGSRETLRIAEQRSITTSGITSTSYDYSWITRDAREGATLTRESQLFGGDVYSLQYVTVSGGSSVSAEDGAVPLAFALDANYPNPFNPATTIGFTLAQPAHVRLTVHNLLGQRVATLVDHALPAGAHEIPFEAGELPSGLYLYRLASGGAEQTRTMTLMK